jgi:hypothetical protein
MRITSAISLFAVAALTLAPTALAAQETGPVRVTSCVVLPRDPSVLVMRPNIDLTNGVTVTLLNASDKTATSITVTGSYHGRVVTDTAKLELKPGQTAQISRQYEPSVFIDTDAVCHVTAVQFSDGTSWTLPASPAP